MAQSTFPTVDDRAIARDRVKQSIRRQIALHELVPGQQVVEAQIAAGLGVSRTPVREALRELEQQGLVVSYPHRGSFIRSLTPKDVEDFTFLRAAVEGMAARMAVEHASRAQVRQLERIIGEIGDLTDADAMGAAIPPDLEFHETLVSLSSNGRLLQVWRTFDPLIWTILGTYGTTRGEGGGPTIRHLVERHQQIVAAVLSGDPDVAEQTVREHVFTSGLPIAESMRSS